MSNTYYATFGSGQVGHPGYLEVEADDEEEARERVQKATHGRWGFLYTSLDDVHPNDQIFRGVA